MKKYFSRQDLARISEAIEKAEKKTSGEIAVAFVKQSDTYAIYELLFALILGVVFFNILLFFYTPIEHFIQTHTWHYSTQMTTAVIGLSSFIFIALLYLLFNIPFLDRLIVPKKVMKKKVSDRAFLHFIQAGITETRDRSGILIFISHLERRVMIIADKGINQKIEQGQWAEFIDEIVLGIKKGHLTDHLVQVIRKCGYLLEEHFPIKDDDTNELSNEMTILER